ncbi:MAG: FlgB family protein [Planctomycetes bacterium]|nr:FlgB family protein [Planctomycetota bacterium]
MFSNLNVFKMANAMATHAGQRQAVIAKNIANADTPGYKAQDISPFATMYQSREDDQGMRASRAGHLNGSRGAGAAEASPRRDQAADPNGNSVSVEQEMLKAVEVKQQHDRALAIYKSSLNILRTSLGRA